MDDRRVLELYPLPIARAYAYRDARADDRRALEALVDRCRDRLLDAIRARPFAGGQEPEDVPRETFLRATESIGRFEDRGRSSVRPFRSTA